MGEVLEKIQELENRIAELEKRNENTHTLWDCAIAILLVNFITMCILIFQK